MTEKLKDELWNKLIFDDGLETPPVAIIEREEFEQIFKLGQDSVTEEAMFDLSTGIVKLRIPEGYGKKIRAEAFKEILKNMDKIGSWTYLKEWLNKKVEGDTE